MATKKVKVSREWLDAVASGLESCAQVMNAAMRWPHDEAALEGVAGHLRALSTVLHEAAQADEF